ncbi:BTAD domain-containing putative transcriptional regulator [Actinoplanes sp. G11-F43]|uniref:BTAD domain-containing putative transcriptional regulator n=1 Tax=Actinoplanes sp. G11-F43 TaxID=3424130 RepID=UPI003D33F8E6
MLMHRLGRQLVRMASALAILALLAGLPAALVGVIGWPLPRTVPTDWDGWERILTGGFPDTMVINLLACGLWLVWAAFCYSLIGEIVVARHGRPARHVRALSPLQALAALLVAGMSAGPAAAATLAIPPAVVSTLMTPPATDAPVLAAYATSDTAVTPPTVLDADRGSLSPTALPGTNLAPDQTPLPRFALVAHSGPLTVATRGQQYTVTVQRGDTLWELADRWLGDPHRWPEIYQLNAGRYDDHGRMHDGDHIERGWVLALPDDATPPPGSRPATPPRQPSAADTDDRPGTPATTAPTTTAPEPAASATPSTATTTAPTRPAPATSTSTSTSTSTENLPPASPHSGPPPSTTKPGGNAETPAPTTSASTTPAASASDTADQPQPERSRTSSPGISLASGSWLDVGLAAAVAAAIALVWAHRRRRYSPRPLSPDLRLDDPDLAPMPPAVTQIRRRLHDDTDTDDHDDADAAASWTPPIATPTTHTLHVSGGDPADPTPLEDEDEPDEVVTVLPEKGAHVDADAPRLRPVVPTLTNPAAVWPSSGLGLTGPGAESAARGLLAAALADDDPDAAPSRAVLPSTTAATLLGAAAVTLPSTPRLLVTDDLAEALNLLEQQILHRSRLVYSHEVDTVAAMRAADPYEEPTPPIVLIADAANHHERTRIAALLTQGQRLDIHGILLGDWPAGDTIVVDSDGTTTAGGNTRHGQHPADLGRLAVLTPTETVAVITTLAEAQTGRPQPQPPIEATPPHQDTEPAENSGDLVLPLDDAGRVLAALADRGDATAAAIAAHLNLPYPATTAKLVQWEHTGHTETTRTETGQTLWRLTDIGRDALGTPVARSSVPEPVDPVDETPAATPQTADVEAPAGDRYAEIGTVLQWPDPTTTFTSEHPPAPDAGDDTDKPGHIEVTVLGEASIVATDPDRRPRRKALELLVYLSVHDGSATVEAILDDLMPEAPASKAPERLHTYVSDLRSVMRRISGPATYLTHPHQRYTLNPDTVDVDLWRMRTAIREAHQANDPQQRVTALQRAVDTYRGPLADGADYEWAESYREAIRQQALDAHLALADALTGDLTAQARVLETAIGHSPYSEHLYQRAMRTRAALGHVDAIRTLRRALDRALAEIDTEPSDDTITLADKLIADLRRPGRPTNIETASGSN